MALTQSEWPSSVCSTAPVPASHSLTVLSFDADASTLPSGENATALTELEWPSSVAAPHSNYSQPLVIFVSKQHFSTFLVLPSRLGYISEDRQIVGGKAVKVLLERPHDRIVPVHSGPPQRRPAILCIDVGTSLEQQLHNDHVPVRGSPLQRGPAILILRIDLGALLEQQLHDRLVPVPDGPLQRGPAIFIFRLEVGALLDQQLHNRLVPVGGGP
ncbi:hypothetical protein K469DRAFT_161266 [Zopfia rhizophila CBS 207.26]|uniref:Uncharacterized protein n=1 Tax=Zopfia rhizophila CBS 207.26 TaxID=1314779 RepID=A0A6A6E5S3_9PEZI|nr:hypothetical protein K469DRAFT_161266 [Zopfia rhizophila CBS 207.26]